ncbi:MAG TPA: universal stress protein [Cyclobacteriaceae bacterium]
MRAILVPTDFSENANAAIEYACELGIHLSAEVLIVTSHTPAITQFDHGNALIMEETEKARVLTEKKLSSICKIANEQYPSLVCNYKYVVGGLVESIDTLITTNAIDLVVMGTKGASGLDKILFGSNTTRVIDKVNCPVLAVPRDSPFQIPRRIVYATDFHYAELDHIHELATIASAFKAEIMMVHITTDEKALLSEEMLKRNFAGHVRTITDYASITYFVKYEEHITRALESFTTLVNADWISMFTRKRTLFEKLYNPSRTKAMAYHSKIPLLAIKG